MFARGTQPVAHGARAMMPLETVATKSVVLDKHSADTHFSTRPASSTMPDMITWCRTFSVP